MKYRQRQLRIGDYVIEPLAGLVRRAAEGVETDPRHLQPKVMRVLVYLAERQGEVVEREELIEGVWGRAVTDEVLTRAIHELRIALEDSSGQPRYIETIPKIGYRLMAPVDAGDSSAASALDQSGLSIEEIEAKSDLPLLRMIKGRPATLTGLVIALLVIAIMVNMLRSPPIENGEHGWVVLAGFENFTTDPRLARALDIAFRIGIEQSPRISIIPPVTLGSALARMEMDKDATIDRNTAIEISLREQAQAVIVGAISNVGDSYRLSGEILEPQTGRTIFTHQSTVANENGILRGLDEVVAAIRHESGEALSTIEDNTVPLERVTTANFEALEAYSLGMRQAGTADIEASIPFFEEAIRLDPTFAMAYSKLGYLQLVISDEYPAADWNLEKALEYRDRLTRKEQLYVEALRARNEKPSIIKNAWTVLINAYPNYAEGYRNLGNAYHRFDNDFERAAVELEKAVQIPDLWNPVGFHNLGSAQLGLGRYEAALNNFQTAWDVTQHPMGAGLGIAHIAMKNYGDADAFLRVNRAFPVDVVRQGIEVVTAIYFLDQGKFAQAKEMTKQAAVTATGDTGAQQRAAVARCAILEKGSDRDAFLTCLSDVTARELSSLEEGYFKRQYWPTANLGLLGKIAARNEQHVEARMMFDAVQSRAVAGGYYFIDSYVTILEAELLMGEGQYQEAVLVLQPLVVERALFQAHESLARAYDLAGNKDQAIQEYLWMTDARGQAFVEALSQEFGNEFHILDWATAHFHLGRLYEETGEPDMALAAYTTLLEHWVNADIDIPALTVAHQRLEKLRTTESSVSP